MTGVSKLLYYPRSRAGREPEPDLGFDSLSPGGDSGLRRPPRKHSDHGPRRQRGRREDSDPPPRPRPRPSPRQHNCLRVPQTEPESVKLDRSDTGEYGTDTASGDGPTVVPGISLSRLGLIIDRPLPDTVLQARARLLERLRSVSLVGSREPTIVPGISRDEFAAANEFGYWEAETPIDWSDPNISYAEFTAQTDQTSSFHDERKKPPPGLSWEGFCNLQHEVFRNSEENGDTSRTPECCICLESFLEEEGLVRLHCRHRFHPLCLQPWVQACGDCPYCRANIIC